MRDSEAQSRALVIPRVTPAPKPLRFPANLIQLLSNNLKITPEAAYREDVVIAQGPPRMAFITGAEALKTVLQDKDDEFPRGQLSIDVQAPLFGNALIQSHGIEWRWQRGLMAPLFRHRELLSYVGIMSEVAQEILTSWREMPSNAARSINKDMLRTTFSVISRTLLGGSGGEVMAVLEAGHAAYYRQINWWVLYCMLRLPNGLPRPGGNAMRHHELRLREAVRALVHARCESAEQSNDLLGRLLRAEDPETGLAMTEERLVDNIIAFFVAGSDTTSLALTWALYLIAQSPEWEERIRIEVDEVAGDSPIRAEHLDDLVVVKQVLNETLRLFPTAPVTVRDTLHDVTLSGVHVPAGTIVVISNSLSWNATPRTRRILRHSARPCRCMSSKSSRIASSVAAGPSLLSGRFRHGAERGNRSALALCPDIQTSRLAHRQRPKTVANRGWFVFALPIFVTRCRVYGRDHNETFGRGQKRLRSF